jgi:hypothetical protein
VPIAQVVFLKNVICSIETGHKICMVAMQAEKSAPSPATARTRSRRQENPL